MKKIVVVFCPFPEVAHGKMSGVARCVDGQYQILIDNLNPEDQQHRTLRHEYGHIMCGHFAEPEPEYPSPEYDAREAEAEAYADSMTETEFSALLSLSNIYHAPEVKPA